MVLAAAAPPAGRAWLEAERTSEVSAGSAGSGREVWGTWVAAAGGGRRRTAGVRWEEAAGGGRVWAEFSEAGDWLAGADAGSCSRCETRSWMRLWPPGVSLRDKHIKAHLYNGSDNMI